MNEIALATSPDLAEMTNDQLRMELMRALEMTVESLRRLASIVRLLEERGDDLSGLPSGLVNNLRRIAHGQALPELVVRYAESPALMRTLASLPIPDQQRIADGENVKMVVRRANDVFDTRMVDPSKMTRDQISQVFGRGRIRDESEQILMLEDRSPKTVARKTNHRRGSIRPDPDRGGLMVGRRFFSAGDLVSALAELVGEPDPSPAETGVSVKLTEAEHIALKNAATRTGAPMNVLIRRALMISGLFSGD